MININLLPEKQKIKISKKVKRELLFFVVIICFMFVGIIFAHQYISKKIYSLKSQVYKKEVVKRRLQKKVRKIALLKKQLKVIQGKIDIIKNIRKIQVMPLLRLNEIEVLIPYQKLWFKNLSLNGSSLSLRGIALDNQALAFYIQKLRKSPYINNVLFNKAERKYIFHLKLVDFTCKIKFSSKIKR